MTAIDALAPWPQTEGDVTADSLARCLAVRAYARCGQIHDLVHDAGDSDQRLYVMATGVLVNEYGLIRVLRGLVRHAPEQADEVARVIWRGWEDGALGEWLWDALAVDYGIDPDEVAEAARQSRDEAKTAPKETTHA